MQVEKWWPIYSKMAVWSLGGMLYAWQDKKKLKTRWPFQTLAQSTWLFNITPILTTSFKLPRHLLLLNSVVILVPITQSHLKIATVLWQCTPQYSDPTMSVCDSLWKIQSVFIIQLFISFFMQRTFHDHELQQIPPGCQCKLNGNMPLSKASPAVYTQFQKKNVINGGYQYHHTKSERSHFGNNQKNSNGINLLKMVLAVDGSCLRVCMCGWFMI